MTDTRPRTMREPDGQRAASKPPPPPNPWFALALTVLAPFVVLLLGQVSLPGIDTITLRSKDSASVVALGITPIITAASIVEFVALIVPSWRRLRHGGPEGRSKLGRATVLLAYALALFQGFSIATMLESFSVAPGMGSKLFILLTLAAGLACIHLLAETVSKRGLASGYGLLFASMPLIAVFRQLGDPKAETSAGSILGLLAAIAAVAGVTWYTLERSEPTHAATPKAETYREPGAREQAPPLRLPAPASGSDSLSTAASLLTLPASVALFLPAADLLADMLKNRTVHRAALIVLTVASALLFTRLYNLPGRVAKVFGRVRGNHASRAELEAEARDALRPATAKAIAFLLALLAIEEIGFASVQITFAAVWTALTVALVLDIAAELRARLAMPDLVSVWPEHRPYAIAAVREALGQAGIAVHARGERLRRLLQFFGPYVPIELMVPQKHEKDASTLLRKILLETSAAPEEKIDESPIVPATRARAKAQPIGIFPLAASVMLAVLTLGHTYVPQKQPSLPQQSPPVSLEFTPVDDETKIFDDDTNLEMRAGAQPKGLSFMIENTPVGLERSTQRTYARLVKGDNETMESARARLEAWAQTLTVPEGTRVVLQKLFEYNEDKGLLEAIGWRTYLVKSNPVLTAKDVASASAISDPNLGGSAWIVRLQFGSEGAAKFEAYTRANLKRRLAIMIDGIVESAPVIQAPIPGGVATINMGAGTPEEQEADAKRLAKALGGE